MPNLSPRTAEHAWPLRCQLFLHDVARCLALVHQGELRLGARGRLQSGSLQRLAGTVTLPVRSDDLRTETQGPALSFLVGLLGAAGFVADVDGTLRLAEAGSNWFGAPPAFQVRQLRDVWWLNPKASARWLPPTRHRLPPRARLQPIFTETASWVASLPPGAWTPAAVLIEHLASSGFLSPDRGNLPRVHQAAHDHLVALSLFLLRVPFPCLGLADTREQDGELHVRPIAHGTAWLQAALERAHLLAHASPDAGIELSVPAEIPRFPQADTQAVSVALHEAGEPTLRISVRPHAPALCTFEIMHLAQLDALDVDGEGPLARYRLSRDSLSRALTWGHSVADTLFLLARFADDGLPPAAAAQLHAWEKEMAVITWQAGFRLTTDTPHVLAALGQRQAFRQRTTALTSGCDAWVSRAEAPALWTYLRRLGYDLELPGDLNDWPLDPRLRTPLPLAQLLTILRTYQALRRLVPGLSVLQSGELERSLAASLPDDDLAGVDRLVASHVVLMKHCLKRRQPRGEGQDAGEGAGQQEDQFAPQDNAPSDAPDPAHDPQPPPGSGQNGAPRDELEARLQSAIRAGLEIDLTYADTDGRVTHRRVRPLHIELRWGQRYLLAHCHLRGDERHFRLDRIVEIADDE